MKEEILKLIQDRICALSIEKQDILDELEHDSQMTEMSNEEFLEKKMRFYIASGALAELENLQNLASETKTVQRVIVTGEALALIDFLREKHGPLMFHQSGGCCDGSSPMCYPLGEFIVGDNDILLGEIGQSPFYMSKAQFEYWKHTQLIIDVVPGRGGMFSLEGPEGKRFLTRSRVFTADEREQLNG